MDHFSVFLHFILQHAVQKTTFTFSYRDTISLSSSTLIWIQTIMNYWVHSNFSNCSQSIFHNYFLKEIKTRTVQRWCASIISQPLRFLACIIILLTLWRAGFNVFRIFHLWPIWSFPSGFVPLSSAVPIIWKLDLKVWLSSC